MNKFSKDIGIRRYNEKENKEIRCISIIEEFVVDLTKHRMRHLSWNLDSRNFLKTHEMVTYRKPLENSEKNSDNQDLNTNTILIGQPSPNLRPASKIYYDRVAQITGSQCVVEKDLAVFSNFGILASPIQKFALNRWNKNERKATHGLCFSVANQIYNKNLAKEFENAGLDDTALKNLQAKLSGYREKLYWFGWVIVFRSVYLFFFHFQLYNFNNSWFTCITDTYIYNIQFDTQQLAN